MAIAFDAASSATPSANVPTLTWSHTTGSGVDRILWVTAHTFDGAAGSHISGITYNGVSLTLVNTHNDGNLWQELWYLVNPDSGTHDVVITFISSTIDSVAGSAASYTGAAQTGIPDNSNVGLTTLGTSLTVSLNTVADNCWLVGGGYKNTGTFTAGTQTVIRSSATFAAESSAGIFDGNQAVTPAGTLNSLRLTTGNGTILMAIASFAPSLALPPSPARIIFRNANA